MLDPGAGAKIIGFTVLRRQVKLVSSCVSCC